MLATRTPLVIEDVQNDPRFARDVAEDTGYVPKGLMAAPLLHEEGALGVLSVLDRPEQTLFSLQEMELLGLFANQAAIAVDLLLKAREAERLLATAAASSTSSRASPRPSTRSRTTNERPGSGSSTTSRGRSAPSRKNERGPACPGLSSLPRSSGALFGSVAALGSNRAALCSDPEGMGLDIGGVGHLGAKGAALRSESSSAP